MFFVLGFLAVKAWGCSCSVSLAGTPPCESAWRYDAVFTGVVTEITDPEIRIGPIEPATRSSSFPQRKVRIKITEVLVGLEENQKEIVIETGQGGGDCGYSFQRGLEYIIYASKKPGGGFSTGICALTRLVENAAEDLKYFHQLANASPAAEIRVTAYDVNGTFGYRAGTLPQMPVLAGARVIIDGPGVHETSTTDRAGRHIFAGLPPGEYKVDSLLEGYTISHHLQPVQLHVKGCAEVSVPLQLDRSVSGRILTSDGLPASGLTIESVPIRPRHENDLPMAADSATTDANGRYELRQLTTGDYYLGISISHSPTLENPYTRWFYPGTEDPTRAGILHVSDKPETHIFDLTLPVRQHDRVIQGRVFWPDGRPAEDANILMEDPRWPSQVFTILATTDRQGRFTVHALDGTRYRVHATKFANGPISNEPVPIDPGTSPLDLKLVLTRKGYSPHDGSGKGLDDWRKGLGLR
jgi:hypothetical protein